MFSGALLWRALRGKGFVAGPNQSMNGGRIVRGEGREGISWQVGRTTLVGIQVLAVHYQFPRGKRPTHPSCASNKRSFVGPMSPRGKGKLQVKLSSKLICPNRPASYAIPAHRGDEGFPLHTGAFGSSPLARSARRWVRRRPESKRERRERRGGGRAVGERKRGI